MPMYVDTVPINFRFYVIIMHVSQRTTVHHAFIDLKGIEILFFPHIRMYVRNGLDTQSDGLFLHSDMGWKLKAY